MFKGPELGKNLDCPRNRNKASVTEDTHADLQANPSISSGISIMHAHLRSFTFESKCETQLFSLGSYIMMPKIFLFNSTLTYMLTSPLFFDL